MPGSWGILTQHVKRHIAAFIDERIKEVNITNKDFYELKAIVTKLTVEFYEAKAERDDLSPGLSCAFEDIAYRNLPKVLKETYGNEVLKKYI